MKQIITCLFFCGMLQMVQAQSPQIYTSSDILLKLKKLKVYGAVLYIAAHPDDENTRLLAYLANGKQYRTGYLSLTRGDGGQNLIGNEQGFELGLIRTNELLAARRIDGAEQFFSRAFDFGFSKSTAEALQKWNRELVLSDVVWVIRNFKPDIIITRFPEDNRAGHGHHSASSVLAHEAFNAAADAAMFPEQLGGDVQPWRAKRLLWNTYNFGSINTQNQDQFKMDVGGFNALLGKSYGEMAAESRSQHKSQGFGVPAQRGAAFEYFSPTDGPAPVDDLMDGVETTVRRLAPQNEQYRLVAQTTDSLIAGFSPEHPEKSVATLVRLYTILQNERSFDNYWRSQKMQEIRQLIEICSGLYFEATTASPSVATGDSVEINMQIVNRSGLALKAAAINLFDVQLPSPLPGNSLLNYTTKIAVPATMSISQPYWLERGVVDGHFDVREQQLIGKPLSDPAYQLELKIEIEGQLFSFSKPVQYKHTDPVNGELYQPFVVTPALSLALSPKFIFTHLNKQKPGSINLAVTAMMPFGKQPIGYAQYETDSRGQQIQHATGLTDTLNLAKNSTKNYAVSTAAVLNHTNEKELTFIGQPLSAGTMPGQAYSLRKIEYAHIPSITYFFKDKVKVVDAPIVTAGKKIGYIPGAGDLIPQALTDLKYEVTVLAEKDITIPNLKQFDAIVTGVRAYNIHDWLNKVYDVLMQYVYQGGNLLVQYNTSNYIGPVKSKMGPYPFDISRARVTDENAAVHMLDPTDRIFNWPNKITEKDFEGWIQERGIYFADKSAAKYKPLLGMHDAGENEQQGSLITTRYGQGRFIYTGLVFFRQLPAGVGGAYRLFANLVSNPKFQNLNGQSKTK